MANQKPESNRIFSVRGLKVALLTASIPFISVLFVVTAFVWPGPKQPRSAAFASVESPSINPNEADPDESGNRRTASFPSPLLIELPTEVSKPESMALQAAITEHASATEEAAAMARSSSETAAEEALAQATDGLAERVAEIELLTQLEKPAKPSGRLRIKSFAAPTAAAEPLSRIKSFRAPAETEELRALRQTWIEQSATTQAAQTRPEPSAEPATSLGMFLTPELLAEVAPSVAYLLQSEAAVEAASVSDAALAASDTASENAAIAEVPAPPAPPARKVMPASVAPAVPAAVQGTAPVSRPAPAAPAPPAAPVVVAGLSSTEQQLFTMHNNERARSGIGVLVLDQTLVSIARRRASEMASRGYFGHMSPTGESAVSLVVASGLGYRSMAENIARNDYPDASSASTAMSGFLGSPSHRANILNPNLTRVGIGVAFSGNRKYFAVVFVQP